MFCIKCAFPLSYRTHDTPHNHSPQSRRAQHTVSTASLVHARAPLFDFISYFAPKITFKLIKLVLNHLISKPKTTSFRLKILCIYKLVHVLAKLNKVTFSVEE